MNELIQKIAELIDVLKGRGANYYDGYQGIGHSSAFQITGTDGKKKLPEHKCKFVRLHRWAVGDDQNFSLVNGIMTDTRAILESGNDEIYYGLDNGICGQLFPGRSTDLIPVNNTNQITVFVPTKSATAQVAVHYEWFI